MELDRIFEELVVIPSPSRREGAVAAWVRGFCQARGYAVEEDDAARAVAGDSGNLLVRLPAAAPGPVLLFCAHLDTVETGERPIAFQRTGSLYRSRGETILGADDKTGVACLLAFLDEVSARTGPWRGEIRFLFTVCEEIELLGAKAVPDEWLSGVAAAFALDHGHPGEIVRAAPSKIAFRLTARGVAGHAAHPERRINAAHLLARALGRLPSGQLDAESTCNLGILRAGHAINVIPGSAYAEYELRSHDPARLARYAAETRRTLEEEAAKACLPAMDGDEARTARIEIDAEPCYDAFRLADDALPVRLAQAAMSAAGLGTAKLRTGAGGSDANVLNTRGLPAAVIGCGTHGAHGVRELADLDEMQQCLRVLHSLARGDGA